MHGTNAFSLKTNRPLRLVLSALLSLGVCAAHATTFWTGPNINFSKSASTPSDTILPGKVVLTRGVNEVLYNTAAGESLAGAQSPKGTMWAFGDFTNHTTFQTMFSMRNGNLAGLILNQPMVMWITNDDIFVSVKFTVWGQNHITVGGVVGAFAYTRSTAPTSVPPTVTITNPASGEVFAAPADVRLGATATVAGGTVTNVTFRNNTTPLGSVQSPPFNLTVNGLPAGSYALNAVATAGGLSSTSAVVNFSVVTPVDVTISAPHVSGGVFSFDYSANVGLRYVVERSLNLFDWTALVTNTAGAATMPFSESVIATPPAYYRVGRLPNP